MSGTLDLSHALTLTPIGM